MSKPVLFTLMSIQSIAQYVPAETIGALAGTILAQAATILKFNHSCRDEQGNDKLFTFRPFLDLILENISHHNCRS